MILALALLAEGVASGLANDPRHVVPEAIDVLAHTIDVAMEAAQLDPRAIDTVSDALKACIDVRQYLAFAADQFEKLPSHHPSVGFSPNLTASLIACAGVA